MEICMNKKRVTAVILSAMMCMQIFTGCGAKNNAAAVEGGAGQTATESAQGAAGTVTEENAQTAEGNVQGTAHQDGTEESMTGNDAAEQADSTEVSVPEDGGYTVEVTLEGGSGKATVDSQAKVTVKDGVAYATITWSSTHYDYMIVNGEKYLNENEGGNSTFTFPIDGIPCEMDVIGDTTIAEDREDGSFIWENSYDRENALNVYELALFLPREDGLYEKCEEEHVQKAYSIEAIKAMIVKAGMELVAVCDAYTHNPGDENCERLTFVAREHGKSAQNGYHGRIPEKPETHRAD